MMFLNPNPASQPAHGINAWKIPKNAAIFRAFFQLKGLRNIPAAIETAKASIESPMAIRNSSGKDINKLYKKLFPAIKMIR